MTLRQRIGARLRPLAYWRTLSEMRSELSQLQRDVNALHALAPAYLGNPLGPQLGGWSVAPSALVDMLAVVERHLGTARVLEIGGGMSTRALTTIMAAERSPITSITTVEHDPSFVDALAGLGGEVVHRPLGELEPGRVWFQLTADDLPQPPYDCLIIDGPLTSESDRSCAVDVLESAVSEACVVLVDDTHIADHGGMVERLEREWRLERTVVRPTYEVLTR